MPSQQNSMMTGQSSLASTTGIPGPPSPGSTAAHHASVVTLRAGLAGLAGLAAGSSGHQDATGGFDDDRELGRMLDGGAGAGISFGLHDMLLGDTPKHPPSSSSHYHQQRRAVTEPDFLRSGGGENVNNENRAPPTPRPSSSKLADALAAGAFSPRRPSVGVSSPLRGPSSGAGAGGRPRSSREGSQESRFELLARDLEDQLQHQASRTPLGELPMASSSASRPGPNKASAKNKAVNGLYHHSLAARPGNNTSMLSLAESRDGNGKLRLFLPDVTGLTEMVQTPARAGGRKHLAGATAAASTGSSQQEKEEEEKREDALGELSKRLKSLERDNALSGRRVEELEVELRTVREREEAAREEWVLEREQLRREAAETREKAKSGEGDWERRYWEVVEEKKGTFGDTHGHAFPAKLLTPIILPVTSPRNPRRLPPRSTQQAHRRTRGSESADR